MFGGDYCCWVCLLVCLCFVVFFFLEIEFFIVYSPGCLGTHCVDQAGPKLGNSPASASQGHAPLLPRMEFLSVRIIGSMILGSFLRLFIF